MHDLAIENGIIVDARRLYKGTIYVDSEKIAEIANPGEPAKPAKERIDATGKYVLPGIIDAHLHPVYADGMDNISRAAIAEGTTTLVPYLGAVKAWGQDKGLVETLDDFIENGDKISYTDYGIHCTLVKDDVDSAEKTIPLMIERGIISFKLFLAYSKRGMMLRDREILRIMAVVAEHGGLLAAHCENGDIIDHLEELYEQQGKDTPDYLLKAHPNISETESVFRFLSLSMVTGCDVFLPHISARESLDVIDMFRKWKSEIIYVETCPHYLVLTSDTTEKYGNPAKMGPPLRTPADNDALWNGIASNRIDLVGSDAAGHLKEKNAPFFEKSFAAPNGIPGVDSLFKLILNEGVMKGRITFPRLVEVLCENPAKIFGLYPRKGVLAPGSDADILILDTDESFEIEERNPNMNVDYSVYQGFRGFGKAHRVILKGVVTVADGEVVGEPMGKFIPGRRDPDVTVHRGGERA